MIKINHPPTINQFEDMVKEFRNMNWERRQLDEGKADD